MVDSNSVNIPKWEYMTLDSSTNYGTVKYFVNGDQQPALKNHPLHEIINQFGWQGWELVGVAGDAEARAYVFKRLTDKAPSVFGKKPTA